ncbi:MAG: type I phosphomannose isomerase catalytic subunit [Pseudothermotoga sp.]
MILKSIPKAREMIWGSFSLNEIFCKPCTKPVGEVWLLSDFPMILTELQTVSKESFDSHSLNDIFELKLVRFPILIKLIASDQWLSVQVHPDDESAQELENEPWGKSECWFFLKDSVIALSDKNTDLRECLEKNSFSEAMKIVHPRAGDLVYIPAGTLHAIGPGSVLIEIQQSSDLTYRVHDWGRGRELHVEKALKVMKKVCIEDLIFPSVEHFECDYFKVYRCQSDTHVFPNSIVVTLTDGEIDNFTTKEYETYLITGGKSVHVKGDVLVVKLGSKWWQI